MPTVKINGKEYQIHPLKVKHLRRITEIMKENQKSPGLFVSLDRWSPFILESIQVYNPNFTEDDLSEATLNELMTAWDTIVQESGIKFVTGEPKPAESTGDSSMGASPAPSAGTTVQ